MGTVYDEIVKGGLAVLLDPDKESQVNVDAIVANGQQAGASILLVGGSLVTKPLDDFVVNLRASTSLPVVVFPGSAMQFSPNADAILFLSLISGRNPDFLIGHHATVAPMVKRSGVEVIPTGYILIDGGTPTSVQYMSQTMPIPASKPDIAVATAIAGELLGLQAIYLEAGSGAKNAVPAKLIEAVRNAISIPLIVGGGIRTKQQYSDARNAGADLVVVGNGLEENPKMFS
ncbi:MAG TPA: geranylgeranylglyceryl/heptaprenylglyceryl phosphate synthase [Bacteroidales bacterium]|nr:geranylgeranylglyceryl/heptaprenylglyceryl phosphate synthase [Bacteroidales bacterium]